MKFESGTRRDRIKMIGNAVCPPVMRHVIRTLTSGDSISRLAIQYALVNLSAII